MVMMRSKNCNNLKWRTTDPDYLGVTVALLLGTYIGMAIVRAIEYAGYKLVRGCGCRGQELEATTQQVAALYPELKAGVCQDSYR